MVADELAIGIAERTVSPGSRVLDPFCGSGRLLFAASAYGASCVGLDVNPLACLITEAKATAASAALIEEIARESIAAQKISDRVEGVALRNADVAWFSASVARELAQIIAWVNKMSLERPDLLVIATALSAATRDASWIRKSGWKLHRMTREVRESQTASAWQSFQRRLRHYLSGVSRIPSIGRVDVHRITPGNIMDQRVGLFDTVLTSPPYGDSRTTVQYGAASSICLDIVSRLDGLTHLYLPGRVIDAACLGGRKTAEAHLGHIDRFWDGPAGGNGHDRVTSFFQDFLFSCRQTVDLLKPKATIVLVVGRRTVEGFQVRFDEFAIAQLEGLGFEFCASERRRLVNKSLPHAINRFARASSFATRERGRTSTMNEEIILTFRRKG